MVDKSQTQDPGNTRSSTWAKRNPVQLDNPVKRWLGRARESGTQEKHRPQVPRRLVVRPAV